MKIFMIVMTGHPISDMYKRLVTPSWRGKKIHFFEAVTPKDLPYKTALKFGKKVTRKNTREFTDTEKAVWYSHYELWCKCIQLRESILILEHDSMLTKPLPDLKGKTHKFLSYVYAPDGKTPVMAPGSGYFITPVSAQVLVANAVATPNIVNSDGHLGFHLDATKEKKERDFAYIEQVSIDGLNTIDHKNPEKQFVGPDYENFDLPSIHG
jgi:hypothetical protein